MTLTTPYSATFVIGDGETKQFSYLFDEVSENFISVMVYNTSTGITTIPTFTVDTDQKYVLFGDETPAPTADEVVCIYRNTPEIQDVSFRTLQGYDAKSLENILSKIVAMIQEMKSNYFSTQVLQGDPWQLDLLSSADDGATVNIDYTAKKLVKGLYFRITSGNLQVSADGSNYITMPKSTDVAEFRQQQIELPDHTYQYKLQYRVGSTWYDAEANAQNKADAAYNLAETVQNDLSSHVNNQLNPHQTSVANLTDTQINNPTLGHVLRFNGTKWVNTSTDVHVEWGEIEGTLADQTDLQTALDAKVNKDGTSIMTAPLKFMSGSVRGAVGPYFNGVGFWKLDSQGNLTQIASISDSQFIPTTTSAIDIGNSTKKWKDLYLSGKAYVGTINNGYDISVPAYAGTMVVADFTGGTAGQLLMLDSNLKPVWGETSTYLTYPAGWTTTGTTKAFCDDIAADNSAVVGKAYLGGVTLNDMPSGIGNAEIVVEIMAGTTAANKVIKLTLSSGNVAPYMWVYTYWNGGSNTSGWQPLGGDSLPSQTGNNGKFLTTDGTDASWATVDALPTQTGHAGEYLTTDGSSASWAAINVGSGYHPELFAHEWDDKLRDDISWLRADTFSWQPGSTYKAAYKHLRNDMYQWYSWEYNGTTIYTKKRYPEVGEKAYTSSALTTEFGEITAIDDEFDGIGITVGGNHYDGVTGASVVPTTETIAGVTVQYIPAEDGHKIVTDFHTSEVEAVYAATGVAWYYIIDYGFYRFKLPRRHSQQIIRSVINNDGTWYRLYADGWIEQGGKKSKPNSSSITVSLPVAMADSAYYVKVSDAFNGNMATAPSYNIVDASNFTIYQNNGSAITCDWEVAGMSSIDISGFQNGEKYLYFYVGEFTQTAIENTAGLNAELFNDKVDLDSSWGFPSDTYDDLTLGASGATYTAPADGYILIACTGDAGKAYMEVCGPSNKYLSVGAACNGGWGRGCGAIAKGQSFSVYYGGTNFTKQLFRFVYAKKSN